MSSVRPSAALLPLDWAHMAKRIAILIFDGFSLYEASSIAEVFRLADEIEGERLRAEPAPTQQRGTSQPGVPAPHVPGLSVRPPEPAEPYALVVVSGTGGSIASSATMRVWSENLDTYAATGFHALFVPGGSGAAGPAADESFLRRLHAVIQHTRIVKAIGEGSAIVVAATAKERAGAAVRPAAAPLAATSATTAAHGEHTAAIDVAIDDPLGAIAAALSIVKRDRGAQAAREIADRSAPGAWRRLGAVLGELDDEGTHQKIDTAARWMRENYAQPISVAKAAEVAAMSERSFLRRFKSQIGVTPSEYLLRTRLDASCRLLVATDLPVDKIARRCGIGSGDGLAKMFRKRLSISPTEYRIAERRRSQ
ncbi:HTH-type transcriptional activator RhaS [Trinickia soli]|uniref:AraC family transcriptional regulator n=2 Tax=Trinickia soli TaxID=380675 RepID=A0A2N7WD32_9BURK|nr:AraC family transcriptional regulator [Trinickia soli]CAB3638885.1 HTH-type transcriptional activator RhaS [Trinickia soli]